VGFGVVIAIAAAWCTQMVEHFTTGERVYDNLFVRSDGTPLIHRSAPGGYYATWHTLDGKEVPTPRHTVNGADLKGPREFELYARRFSPFNAPFPLSEDERVACFSDRQRPPTFWYFVHDGTLHGRGYFVGFASQSKHCVGYVGRGGTRRDVPPAEDQFPVDGRLMGKNAAFAHALQPWEWYSAYDGGDDAGLPDWKVPMISEGQLLVVDLRGGSVATVMKSPEVLSVRGFQPAPPPGADEETKLALIRRVYWAVRAADRILILDAAGKQLRSYLIPEDLRGATLKFYEITEGSALVTTTRTYRDYSKREELLWIDEAGKIARRAEVGLAPKSKPFNERAETWKAAPIVPEPIILLAGVAFGLISHLEAGVEPSYASALKRSLAAEWPPQLAVFAVAAVLAWFSYRRHQRFALPWAGVWAAFVFLGGIPGFLAYLFHRRWAVLESCPTCNLVVPHDREACSHCGAEFPGPEPKGIEVFA